MKKTLKLQAKILLFFTVFILVLSIITTAFGVRGTLNVGIAIFAKEGQIIAEQVASMIDGDKFEALSRSLDHNDPFYEEIRLELLKIWNETTLFYLYTATPGGSTGYLYIIDGSGEIDSDTFSFLGDEVDPDDMDSGFEKTWQTRTSNTGPLHAGEWGYLISVYEPIFNSQGVMVGIVGCDFDAEFLYFSLRGQIIEKIILGIIFAAAGVLIMFLLVRPIFVRLSRIGEILVVLARGEGNLSSRITIKRNDEIDNVADLFNKTLDRICELLLLVKDQTVNLSNVGNELSENMNATSAAVTEITGNIQHIKDQVINQSASVDETNATMEQVVDNISRLNTQVETQTESVSQSSSAIEEMIANIQNVTNTLVKNAENVNRLTAASDTGRTSLEEVSRDIQEIARESEGILEINSVMVNIASQTNLLSMNAAIEAAHAGEAGKGFAVVADEIRKLAESSSNQSKTISAVLKKIKESIDKIIKSTGMVMDRFQDIDTEVQTVSQQQSNIRSAMEEQSVGSKQILEAIGLLLDITRRVKEGSAEMLEGSQQVIKEGKSLADTTQEITTGVNDIASGADYINSAVGRVRSISNNNKDHINALSTEVDKFNIVSTAEYVWDSTFAVGHELIDSEHQKLFAAINNLIRACGKDNRQEFDENIAFLESYVDKHFSDEEEVQKSQEYPEYENHKRIHDEYKAVVRNLAAKLLSTGPTETTPQEIRTLVGSWLINHIKAQDVKIGAYIRSRKA